MRTIFAIGGGELKSKTTLEIDEYIANKAKLHAGDKRAYGLFVGTASHDSMPYFNSFRKTYTSCFDIKADCALTVYGEMDFEKIKQKFEKADLIYIGGGDTIFMLNEWEKSGLDKLVLDAYQRGVVIAGLSAGAIFWFKTMYTDSAKTDDGVIYSLHNGLDILDGVCSPHYNHRQIDFDDVLIANKIQTAFAICDNAALEFNDEKLVGAISSGGEAFVLRNNNSVIEKFKIELIK